MESTTLLGLVNRKVQHLSEFNADNMSAECNPQIAKGGVDFFTRRLKLNLVQRSFLEKRRKNFLQKRAMK